MVNQNMQTKIDNMSKNELKHTAGIQFDIIEAQENVINKQDEVIKQQDKLQWFCFFTCIYIATFFIFITMLILVPK